MQEFKTEPFKWFQDTELHQNSFTLTDGKGFLTFLLLQRQQKRIKLRNVPIKYVIENNTSPRKMLASTRHHISGENSDQL